MSDLHINIALLLTGRLRREECFSLVAKYLACISNTILSDKGLKIILTGYVF